eukprot:TRINITY_DN1414_c0_g2_i1.p2 TRINITY_DN1414_c0_g2~~TRINITY_DN1414_c0_g2_i1.p2  ORF type:complete len:376 (-),score=44.98 TRINITY_DN1414_c0_g2_i1:1848-2975(-)
MAVPISARVESFALMEFNSATLPALDSFESVIILPEQTIDSVALQLKFKGELGQGRYGIVEKYVAGDGTVMALKRMKPELAKDTVIAKQFMREMNTVKSLSHKNIVKFLGISIGTPQKIKEPMRTEATLENVHFAQEILSGGTLSSMILKQMMEPHRKIYIEMQALNWARQLASGLAYLHSRKEPILHRDLNCKNILLDSKDFSKANVKIVDFGLHTVLTESEFRRKPTSNFDDQDNEDLDDSSGLSRKAHLTGNTGCYMYMAPEILKNKKYNEKADIFSLGIIFYELFLKRLSLFDVHYDLTEQKVFDFAQRVAGGHRMPLPPRLDPQVKEVIQDCWNHDEDLRPSAQEIESRLQEIIDSRIEKKFRKCACISI